MYTGYTAIRRGLAHRLQEKVTAWGCVLQFRQAADIGFFLYYITVLFPLKSVSSCWARFVGFPWSLTGLNLNLDL